MNWIWLLERCFYGVRNIWFGPFIFPDSLKMFIWESFLVARMRHNTTMYCYFSCGLINHTHAWDSRRMVFLSLQMMQVQGSKYFICAQLHFEKDGRPEYPLLLKIGSLGSTNVLLKHRQMELKSTVELRNFSLIDSLGNSAVHRYVVCYGLVNLWWSRHKSSVSRANQNETLWDAKLLLDSLRIVAKSHLAFLYDKRNRFSLATFSP